MVLAVEQRVRAQQMKGHLVGDVGCAVLRPGRHPTQRQTPYRLRVSTHGFHRLLVPLDLSLVPAEPEPNIPQCGGTFQGSPRLPEWGELRVPNHLGGTEARGGGHSQSQTSAQAPCTAPPLLG